MSNHQNLKIVPNIWSVAVTTCFKYHRCSKSMRSSILHALYTLNSPRFVTQLQKPQLESSQPWLSENTVTQPWVKPQAGADCRRQNLRLKTLLRFTTVRFANLVEMSQPDSSRWHSTFCKSWLLASADISLLLRTFPTLIWRPVKAAPSPRGRCPPTS